MPTTAGITLLDATGAGGVRQSQTIALPSPPTAVAQLDTLDEEGDRTSVVVFVRDRTLQQTWRDEK